MPLTISAANLFSQVSLLLASRSGLSRRVPVMLTLSLSPFVFSPPARAAAAATVTTLAVTAAGKPVATTSQLPIGTVVTLTATVTAGGTAVNPGQVNFCDAKAKYCTDVHLLATVELTKAGTATYRFRPGKGNPSYKAVFVGTKLSAASSSSAASFWIVGPSSPVATATAIAGTGSWGAYALSAIVTEMGSAFPLTGKVSFLDTSLGSAILETAPIGTSVPGIGWLNLETLQMDTFNQAIALADFNGDGLPDVALISGGTSSPIQVYLASTDGTYTLAPSPAISDYTFGPIVVADLNGDGNQDMAILNGDTDTVSILLGNGDGTFNVLSSGPSVGLNPNQLALGDFNGDGIPDLVVTSNSTNTVTVFLGKGNGTFSAGKIHTLTGSTPYAIAVGDFNADGMADLAVADAYSDSVSILLGKGDGTLTTGAVLHSGANASRIVAADFNRDGKLDLAVAVVGANFGPASVIVLPGNGDGTFNAPVSATPADGSNVSTLAVADFNLDGIPDLALTDGSTGRLMAFLGKGDGTFSSFARTVPQETYEKLLFAIGDADGDGRPDIFISNGASDTTGIYLTQPTQTAAAKASVALPAAGQHLVEASYAGDTHNNAGVSGTLALWGVPPTTSITLKLTSGTNSVTSVAAGTIVTLKASVAAGTKTVPAGQVDFCDGAAAHCTDIHWLGTASLTPSGTAIFRFAPGTGAHSYKAEFVEEGLGKASTSNTVALTVGPAHAPQYSATAAIGVSGFPGNYSLSATVEGIGGPTAPTGKISFVDTTFGNKVLATADLASATAGNGWILKPAPAVSSTSVIGEVVADFNSDGIPDLAILWSSGTTGPETIAVTIFTGKGDGTFAAGHTANVLSGDISYPNMIAGDFTGDGNTDLAVLTWNESKFTSNVTVLPGKGDGTFSASVTNPVYSQGTVGGDGVPGTFVAADFNGDGKLDLAVVGEYVSNGGAVVLLGNGDGTFTPGSNIDPKADFGLIATGDFNGDGIPDLVVTNYFEFGTAPTVFLGKGDGTFTSMPMNFKLDYFPTSIAVGDFNGDGVLDLAFSDLNGVEIALGAGNGTFKETAASPILVPSELYSLAVGDFNHDGKVDIAGLDTYNNRIVLLIGAGNGTFAVTPTTPVVNQGFNETFQIVAADFNKDGVPDLAMLTRNVNKATTLLNVPTETESVSITGIAPVGAGTHAVEAVYSGDSHYAKIASSKVELTAGLEPPTFSPAPGTYTSQQKITINEAIPGATIYYQAQGTVNTTGFVQYTGPFFLPYGGAEYVTAYATETGYQQSSYVYATFNIVLPAAPAPTFSVAAGSYSAAQTVTISDTAPGATIYYTTNGTYPSVYSSAYTGPITVSSSELVSAITVAPGYSQSGTASAQYLIASSKSRFIYTVAGTHSFGYTGDGGQATFASLQDPYRIVRDAAGNLYFSDGNVIRKVAAATTIITTVAGNGRYGNSGDGKAAKSAQLEDIGALALDAAGNLYITDGMRCTVRKITASSGIINTIAGNGTCLYAGDNGAATKASLNSPQALAVDKAGNLYIGTNGTIRKIAAGTGIISTFAGTGNPGYSGDHGPAKNAQLGAASAIVFDSAGDMFFTDSWENVVRKIASGTTIITTVAGVGPQGMHPPGIGDGGPATLAVLSGPQGLAIDAAGDLIISDSQNSAVREVTASDKIINTIAGGCWRLGGDGGPAIDAELCYPTGLAIDPSGNIFVSETYYSRIREVTAPQAPPATATAALVFSLAEGTYPTAMTLTIKASAGAEVYISLDGSAPSTSGVGYYTPIAIAGPITVRAVALEPGHLPSAEVKATYNVTASAPATVNTVAGSGIYSSPGSGGPALKAGFGDINDVTSDAAGNLFIADPNNAVVWRLSAATKTVSAYAGIPGTHGFFNGSGGGLAKEAILDQPEFVAVDPAGNLFISDGASGKVLKVSAKTGIISTYSGGGSSGGYPTFGDGGPATSAYLAQAAGIAFDKAGNLYVADQGLGRIRQVSAATGIINSVAGSATATSLGDGGLATNARLSDPVAVAVDAAGNLYIADRGNARIRMVAAKTQIITTIAGNGIYGSAGDGLAATSASVEPWGVAVNASGTVYITNIHDVVREFVPGGKISTIAGTGYLGFSGDGGPARVAEFCGPAGIHADKTGNLFIADSCNYRIREISFK